MIIMKIYSFSQENGKVIEQFGSKGVKIHPLVRPEQPFQIGYFYLDKESVLGMHPAMCDQLLMVTGGRGWVQVEGEEKIPVQAGTAVFWEKGEMHETSSDVGLTAIVAEGEKLEPDRFLSIISDQ